MIRLQTKERVFWLGAWGLWCACAAIAVVWVANYWIEGYVVAYLPGRMHEIFWVQGRVEYQTIGDWDSAVHGSWHNFYPVNPAPIYARGFYHVPAKPRYWLGFSYQNGVAGYGNNSGTVAERPRPLFAVVAPDWFLLMGTVGMAAGWQWWVWPGWRRRARKRAGVCLVCAYDLRESKERCPECGRGI